MNQESEMVPSRDLSPEQGGALTSKDELEGQSWVSFCVPFVERGTFVRWLCYQGPILLLEPETILNFSFSDSAGQLFQEDM